MVENKGSFLQLKSINKSLSGVTFEAFSISPFNSFIIVLLKGLLSVHLEGVFLTTRQCILLRNARTKAFKHQLLILQMPHSCNIIQSLSPQPITDTISKHLICKCDVLKGVPSVVYHARLNFNYKYVYQRDKM